MSTQGSKNLTEATVVAKCVGCGKRREIKAGEIAANDMPMCEACYMPMVAERAKRG